MVCVLTELTCVIRTRLESDKWLQDPNWLSKSNGMHLLRAMKPWPSKLRFLGVSKLSILCATNSFLLWVIGRRIGKFKFANCVCNFLTLQSVQIAKIGSAAAVAHHPIILFKNHPSISSCISLLFHNNNLQFDIFNYFFWVNNAAKQHQWHNAINRLHSVIYAFAILGVGFAILQIA